MNNRGNLYYRYFVYSSEEESNKIAVHGKNAKFGVVIVNGILKRYTSILKSKDDAKSDAIILIEGNINKIKYVPPERM